jgi:hypothetical protein
MGKNIFVAIFEGKLETFSIMRVFSKGQRIDDFEICSLENQMKVILNQTLEFKKED